MVESYNIRAVYAKQLNLHAHILIAEAYTKIDFQSFVTSEETTITGELVRRMREYLESYEAPSWGVYYSIGDDSPLSVDGKYGKYRPRIDIEVERTGIRGTRPRLRFEAKRLGKTSGHTVSTYLGPDGMGCFISGKYPLTHDEAGMLGYLQSDNENEWSNKIENALVKGSDRYHVVSPPYRKQKICSLEHTYLSHHFCDSRTTVISIHHILLRFY